MIEKTYKVKKVGKGTEDDPIRPDLSEITEIQKLNSIIKDKEVNETLYIVECIKETKDGFEVRIKWTDKALSLLGESSGT